MAQNALAPPHYLVQIEAHFSFMKMLSWEGGQNILIVCSICTWQCYQRIARIECNVLLDESPTVTETRKAIKHLSAGKAPDADAISAKVFKGGGLPMAEKLTCFNACGGRRLSHKT